MKEELPLDKVQTTKFGQYIVLGLSDKWLLANNGKQLEFDAKLTKDGNLVLSARLERLSDRTKEVDDIVM